MWGESWVSGKVRLGLFLYFIFLLFILFFFFLFLMRENCRYSDHVYEGSCITITLNLFVFLANLFIIILRLKAFFRRESVCNVRRIYTSLSRKKTINTHDCTPFNEHIQAKVICMCASICKRVRVCVCVVQWMCACTFVCACVRTSDHVGGAKGLIFIRAVLESRARQLSGITLFSSAFWVSLICVVVECDLRVHLGGFFRRGDEGGDRRGGEGRLNR